MFEAGRAGVVRLAAFATAITGLVVPAMLVLAEECPGISVLVEEIEPPECFTRLDAGEVDIAVTVEYPLGPGPDDPRYQRTELCRDPLLAVVPDTHAHAGDRVVSIGDLAADRWIAGAYGHPCFDITMAACTAAHVTPRISHHANDWDAVIALVAVSAGVALVPALALINSRHAVTALPVSPQAPARSIYAAVRNGSANAPHIAVALNALRTAAAKLEVGAS